AAQLHSAARLSRQQCGLVALWEVSGVLRRAIDARAAAREACGRIAAALELRWLALLAPDEHQALATVLLARGTAASAPRLHSAHLEAGAEAMRDERTLVCPNGDWALTCQPIRLVGGTPAVLLAYGEQLDAATLALLMLFG